MMGVASLEVTKTGYSCTKHNRSLRVMLKDKQINKLGTETKRAAINIEHLQKSKQAAELITSDYHFFITSFNN